MSLTDSEILKPDAGVLRGRTQWRYTGAERPAFAHATSPGQESVWDFPRPPRVEAMTSAVEIRHNNRSIAQSSEAVRCCETAGAPTWYLPPHDVDLDCIGESGDWSMCEWKGLAQGLDVDGVANAAWRYVRVFPEFAPWRLWCAFYPAKLECFVDGEQVAPQPGGYYGGWVTSTLVGPIKGEPGSSGW